MPKRSASKISEVSPNTAKPKTSDEYRKSSIIGTERIFSLPKTVPL